MSGHLWVAFGNQRVRVDQIAAWRDTYYNGHQHYVYVTPASSGPAFKRPSMAEWESGVGGAQCDRCGRTTIVRPAAWDMLMDPTEWTCRPCVNWEDDDEPEYEVLP